MNEPAQQPEIEVVEGSRARPRQRRDVAVAMPVEQPQPAGRTPLESALRALREGVKPDDLKTLLAVQKEWEANEARKAYTAAMAAFKQDPPEILKNRKVKFTNRAGEVVQYTHATLDSVCDAIIAGLAKHDISHRWITEQANGMVRVTCTLTHKLGHSESAQLESAPDTSGSKNSIQAIASAVTYLERYTLLAVSGMAARGTDDDAAAFEGEKVDVEELITDGELADLRSLLKEYDADEARLLKHLCLEKLEQIQRSNLKAVCDLVRTKAKR